MKNASLIIVCFLLLLSCVGEDLVNDYVDPDLRISNAILVFLKEFNINLLLVFLTNREQK